MNILSIIHIVRDIDEYVSLTQNVLNFLESQEVTELCVAQSLENMRSFEIQYFEKYQKTGAAFLIFISLLRLPPSQEWGENMQCILSLLQYWIDGVRSHLISHCQHWWQFLKILLKFINGLRLKHRDFQNGLAEFLTESLLELISNPRLEYHQRHRVLLCLNLTLITSSKAIRDKLLVHDDYFTKAGHLLTTPHPPTQEALLELLLRVLTRRTEPAVRRAALRWLPAALPAAARALWVANDFISDFSRTSRKFLRIVNAAVNDVATACVRRMTVGTVQLVTGTGTSPATWVDVSAPYRCLTVVLERDLFKRLGEDVTSWRARNELLTVTADMLESATMRRHAFEVTLSLSTLTAPRYMNASTCLLLPARALSMVVYGDLRTLDGMLQKTFGDKYTPMIFADEECYEVLSPDPAHGSKRFSSSEDENTRPLPTLVKRNVIPKRRSRSACRAPSKTWETESNTSFATSGASIYQLQEKLRALPQPQMPTARSPVQRAPTVPTLQEHSEPESTASTLKIAGRDRAGMRVRDKNMSMSSPIYKEGKPTGYDAPVASEGEERTLLRLLVPTKCINIDESSQNAIIERLNNSKDFELINKVYQEGKKTHTNRKQGSQSANTDEKVNSEAIENTPVVNTGRRSFIMRKKTAKVNHCTVLSTSDESNTESAPKAKATTSDESSVNISALPQSPINYVNDRRKKAKEKIGFPDNNEDISKPTYDEEDGDDFFLKGIIDSENVVSPTVARKVNESNSESNGYDADCFISNVERIGSFEITETAIDSDIVDCVESMINSICKEFCRNTGDSEVDLDAIEQIGETVVPNAELSSYIVEDEVPEINADAGNKITENDAAAKPRKQGRNTLKVKLSFNKLTARKEKASKKKHAKKDKNKLEVKEVKPCLQDQENSILNVATEKIQDKKKDQQNKGYSNENESGVDTPLARGKRKLYSLKDEIQEVTNVMWSESEEDVPLAARKQNKQLYTPTPTKTYTPKPKSRRQTPKSAATYTDIEKERQNKMKQIKNRKPMQKTPSLSPRSLKKNQLFDQVKENIISNDDIILMDKKSSERDLAVYNFTSGSEGEEFEIRSMNLSKRMATVKSVTTKKGRPKTRAVKCTEISEEEVKVTKNKGKRVTKKQTPKGRKPKIEPIRKLIDERMRDAAADIYNESFIIEDPNSKHSVIESEPALHVGAVMETMPEIEVDDKVESSEVKTVKKKNKKLSLKKEKGGKGTKNKKTVITERERSESPLPALIIESAPKRHYKDDGSTTSSKLIRNCEKLIRRGNNYIVDTTQNLLTSDVETVGLTDDDLTEMDVAVISKVTDEYSKKDTETCKEPMDLVKEGNAAKKAKQKKPMNKPTMVISDTEDTFKGFEIERSISTVGHSPITAHGDFDEPPPHTESLHETIHPRNLEVQDMSPSTKEHFIQLCRAVETPRNTSVIPLHTPQNSSRDFKRKPQKQTANAENSQLKLAKKNAKKGKQNKKVTELGENSKSVPNTKITKSSVDDTMDEPKIQDNKHIEKPNKKTETPKSIEVDDSVKQEEKLQNSAQSVCSSVSLKVVLNRITDNDCRKDIKKPKRKTESPKSIEFDSASQEDIQQSSAQSICSSVAPKVLKRITDNDCRKDIGKPKRKTESPKSIEVDDSVKREENKLQNSAQSICSSVSRCSVVLTRIPDIDWRTWWPSPPWDSLSPEPKTQGVNTKAKCTIKQKPRTNKDVKNTEQVSAKAKKGHKKEGENVYVHIQPLEVITVSDDEEPRYNKRKRVHSKSDNKNENTEETSNNEMVTTKRKSIISPIGSSASSTRNFAETPPALVEKISVDKEAQDSNKLYTGTRKRSLPYKPEESDISDIELMSPPKERITKKRKSAAEVKDLETNPPKMRVIDLTPETVPSSIASSIATVNEWIAKEFKNAKAKAPVAGSDVESEFVQHIQEKIETTFVEAMHDLKQLLVKMFMKNREARIKKAQQIEAQRSKETEQLSLEIARIREQQAKLREQEAKLREQEAKLREQEAELLESARQLRERQAEAEQLQLEASLRDESARAAELCRAASERCRALLEDIVEGAASPLARDHCRHERE